MRIFVNCSRVVQVGRNISSVCGRGVRLREQLRKRFSRSVSGNLCVNDAPRSAGVSSFDVDRLAARLIDLAVIILRNLHLTNRLAQYVID